MKLSRRPAQEEKRTVIRFSWIPTEMTNGNRIWLEKYKDHQEYYRSYCAEYSRWSTICCEEIRK